MHSWRSGPLPILYCLLTGALLGLGTISIFTVGWTLLMLGLALAIYGILQLGPRHAWALAVGCGALPALVLAFDLVWPAPLCSVSGPAVIPFWVMCDGAERDDQALGITALVFAAIALVGLALGLTVWFAARLMQKHRRASRQAPPATQAPTAATEASSLWGQLPPAHLIVLATALAMLLTLPAYAQTVLARLGMLQPPLFFAFPLLVVAVSLLHGWRGWLGMLTGYFALQVLLLLFIGLIGRLVPSPCGASVCMSMGFDPLTIPGAPGPIFFAGATAGLPVVLVHAALRRWSPSSRLAAA